MNVCFLALFYDTSVVDPGLYLDEVPPYRHLPAAVAARGHDVHLVHLFPVGGCRTEGGVDYRFVAEPRLVRVGAAGAGRVLGREPARFEPGVRTLRQVRSLRPDVLHVHGADLHLNLALLRVLTRGLDAGIVLHYHGGYPSTRKIARSFQRFGFGGVDRFLFTTAEHAQPFVDHGLIASLDRVHPLMELSSAMVGRPKRAARRKTRMEGRPVFVWTGRLHPVKDPLTALRGFKRVLDVWPEAVLYMYYRTAELLPQVEAFLAARPRVRVRVHLRGRAAYAEMAAVYSSADFFLQASRREFSGCAVLEALSCGALPVVTDIPSFRSMTEGGRHGCLFPVGDAEALAGAVTAVDLASLPQRAAAARYHFDEHLSYEAMARRLVDVYGEVLAERTGRQAEGGVTPVKNRMLSAALRDG